VKQRDAENRRGLEGDTQPDRQIAALDLAHRHMRDADPLGQLLKCPAAFTSRQPDTSAEQSGCLHRDGRICARPLHRWILY
jgi:hypothetical protein